jgi:hypothetical protein
MANEELVQAFVDSLPAELPAATAEMPEAIGDRLRALIALMNGVFEGIDADEAKAIIAKATEAITAFSTGNWIGGTMAMFAAFKLFRDAKAN